MKHGVIMIFECNSKSQSDYKYVKFLLKSLYIENNRHLHPIYAGSKTELYSEKTRKKIESILCHYFKGDSIDIIFFADVDSGSEEDKKRDTQLEHFSNGLLNKGFIVWFNKDIEDVFIGDSVDKKLKTKEAEKYFQNKNSKLPPMNRINVANPKKGRHFSNILLELDKAFDRKT